MVQFFVPKQFLKYCSLFLFKFPTLSHSKERKEKVCLNCSATLHGRFCHICGQENLEPKESVLDLFMHFFNDITHFDGKFFSTVKYLISRPGFLSKEYMIGKRASYLNPIRMYVFTSAFFFLVFFSLKSGDQILNENVAFNDQGQETIKDWSRAKTRLDSLILKETDADDRKDLEEERKDLSLELAMARKIYGDTTTRRFGKEQKALLLAQAIRDSLSKAGLIHDGVGDDKEGAEKQNYSSVDSEVIPVLARGYRSLGAYDSAQKAMPEAKKDGWFKKLFRKKIIQVNEQYRGNRKAYGEHFKENFIHSFPKIMFFSLPFFALILKLVYVRRREYYYVNHGIFSIHLFCATFMFFFLLLLSNVLSNSVSYSWVHNLLIVFDILVWLFTICYPYFAMRTFYKQGRGKTFLKYVIVGMLAFIVNLVIMILFLLISAIST